MKKIILLYLIIIFSVKGFSQAPVWIWAQSAGGSPTDYGLSVAMDANDNVYATGVFQSASITFGSTTLLNNSINSYDVFVAKYNSSGNPMWAYSGGGTSIDYGNGICADSNGNVFVAGTFTSTITFGSTTLTSGGNYDVFLAKFDSSGNILWAKKAGGTGTDHCYGVTSDGFGNAFISGKFNSSTITFGNITLINSGSSNMYLAKYDSSGNEIWARRNTASELNGIKTDLLGNVVLAGSFFSSTITFGSSVLVNADVSGNSSDILIVKYDTAGSVIWAERAGGTAFDEASSVSTDLYGNIFITGYFDSPTLAFGSSILNCSSSYYDIFTAKYDSAGNPIWGRRAGGSYNQEGRGISNDGQGNAYVSGEFQSATCTFGSITLTNGGGTGTEDIFIVKYDASGNVVWAVNVGGNSQDDSYAICSNAIGNVCITGYLGSTSIAFGSTIINNASNPNLGDIYVAKLDYATKAMHLAHSYVEIVLFPNPASDEIKIENSALKIKEIEIYSSLGEKVFEKHPTSDVGHMSISVADFPPGIYFVAITDQAGNKVTKKVVKM